MGGASPLDKPPAGADTPLAAVAAAPPPPAQPSIRPHLLSQRGTQQPDTPSFFYTIHKFYQILYKSYLFLEFDMEEIKVKYFTDDIDELCYVEGKSDWIDLHAAETVTMKAGEFRLIPLGVAIALPEGYEAHIVPRSSTFKNYGILQTNSMGVVDYTYRGDGDQWRMPAYATRDVTIEKNARICQFRIVQNQPRLTFTRVEHLDGPDRGGFGSTGK